MNSMDTRRVRGQFFRAWTEGIKNHKENVGSTSSQRCWPLGSCVCREAGMVHEFYQEPKTVRVKWWGKVGLGTSWRSPALGRNGQALRAPLYFFKIAQGLQRWIMKVLIAGGCHLTSLLTAKPRDFSWRGSQGAHLLGSHRTPHSFEIFREGFTMALNGTGSICLGVKKRRWLQSKDNSEES